MNEENLVTIISIGFLPAFLVIWFFVTYMIGRVSGWFVLQERFPDRHEDPIKTLRFQSASIKQEGGKMPASFGNCLKFDICSTGLRVSLWKIFGLTSKPFFIPWSQITVTHRSLIWGGLYDFSFGRPFLATMAIREKTAKVIADNSVLILPARD